MTFGLSSTGAGKHTVRTQMPDFPGRTFAADSSRGDEPPAHHPPEIEHEIAQIFDSIHSSDRALSFIHDLNVLFERIVERPPSVPVIRTSARRALLKHHDDSVFFEFDAKGTRVVIHAVLHQRRDPTGWPREPRARSTARMPTARRRVDPAKDPSLGSRMRDHHQPPRDLAEDDLARMTWRSRVASDGLGGVSGV